VAIRKKAETVSTAGGEKTRGARSRETMRRAPAPVDANETCVLVLQGGGALGSYQAGVFERMAARSIQPHWVAGVSIGAINAALVAGNPPERRLARLREFWERVTSQLSVLTWPSGVGDEAREILNETRAAFAASFGVPGFFTPRIPSALLQRPGTLAALSIYDTTPLAATLDELVDFDLINDLRSPHHVRLSVGAVDVRTGNYRYFDSDDRESCGGALDARHVMASGALPPGFPPVEIDGEFYWDGGVVSNTPLQYVIDQPRIRDTLVIQVDLFHARGPLPENLMEVAERQKDIRFASRTRANTTHAIEAHALGAAARRLAARLPASFSDDPDLKLLLAAGSPAALTILHLIYRSKHHESQSKDYEFSRQSMLERWAAGAADADLSFEHARWRERPRRGANVTVLDLTPRLDAR